MRTAVPITVLVSVIGIILYLAWPETAPVEPDYRERPAGGGTNDGSPRHPPNPEDGGGPSPLLLVRVESANGEPLPGSPVLLLRRIPGEPLDEVLREAVSDESGRAAVRAPSPASGPPSELVIRAEHEGYASEERTVESGAGDLLMVLRSAAVLEVTTVAAEDGAPLPGVSLTLWLDNRVTEAEPWADRGTTDTEGQCRFGPPTGGIVILTEAEGRAPQRLTAVVKPGSPTLVTMTLARTTVIRGRVVDDETSEAVPNVIVVWSGTSRRRTEADAEGRFTAELVGPKRGLRLSAPYYVEKGVTLEGLPPGETVHREFRLAPAGVVQGVVRHADGSPAPGAWVHTRWASVQRALLPGGERAEFVLQADSEGRFEMSSLKPGRPLRIFAALPGSAAGVSGPITPVARKTLSDVEIRLGSPRSVHFRVKSEDGGLPEEIRLVFRVGRVDPWTPITGVPFHLVRQPIALPPEFSLPGLVRPEFDLHLFAPGYVPKKLAGADILRAQEESGRLEVVLEKGLAISGRVLDEEGTPVAGAKLTAYVKSGSQRKDVPFVYFHAWSDDEGNFEVSGLRDWEYLVAAGLRNADGYRHSKPQVVVGGTEGILLILPSDTR